jgi:hypothetical protein
MSSNKFHQFDELMQLITVNTERLRSFNRYENKGEEHLLSLSHVYSIREE